MTMAGLNEQIKTHQRWYRLTTLVMLSAALERYVNDISRTAILSDPSTTAGFPKKLDGFFLAKYDIRLPDIDSSKLVIGDWNSRIAAFKAMFGSVPDVLADYVAELEIMRKNA